MIERQLRDIICRSIDMHVHVGPEVIPRRYDPTTLRMSETGLLAGAVLKNHFYSTVPAVNESQAFAEYGAVVLNWAMGGLNAEAVRAAGYIAKRRFVVWLPTINAANFLAKSEYELAPEWCSGQNIQPRKAADVQGISVLDENGRLTEAAKDVALAVSETGAILATGHISEKESIAMADFALDCGVSAVIVTHPVYQRIAIPLASQRRLAAKGCYMEVCYSMFSIDGISIKRLSTQIRNVGPDRTILSSDVGQLKSVSPSEALLIFCMLLVKEGIPVKWIETMLVTNPRNILEGSDNGTINTTI